MKHFVKVPYSITLESPTPISLKGSVIIKLQEGESLETLSPTELEQRAVAVLMKRLNDIDNGEE